MPALTYRSRKRLALSLLCLGFSAVTLTTGCHQFPAPEPDPLEETAVIGAVAESTGPEKAATQKAARVGAPLPDGAALEAPAAKPAVPLILDTTKMKGTLRPDDKSPAERVPDIIRRGRLVVGVDQSNNLMSYRDTLTGKMRGFEIDIAHEIARDIFGDPNRVDFRFVNSANRIDALEDGSVDLVIRSMTVTAQRQEEVEFSLPYMVSKTRMLVETRSGISDLEDLQGRTACATRGSTSVEWIRKSAPEATIMTTRSWGDCLMALQLGQVDGIITDDAILSGMRAQDPYTHIVGKPLSTEAYAIAIAKPTAAKDSSGLVRQVNSTIQRILTDGTWASSFDKWLGDYLPRPWLPVPRFRDEPRVEPDGEGDNHE